METQCETPLDFSPENVRLEEFGTLLNTLQTEFTRIVKGKSVVFVESTQGQSSQNMSDFAGNSHSISILTATIYDIN